MLRFVKSEIFHLRSNGPPATGAIMTDAGEIGFEAASNLKTIINLDV